MIKWLALIMFGAVLSNSVVAQTTDDRFRVYREQVRPFEGTHADDRRGSRECRAAVDAVDLAWSWHRLEFMTLFPNVSLTANVDVSRFFTVMQEDASRFRAGVEGTGAPARLYERCVVLARQQIEEFSRRMRVFLGDRYQPERIDPFAGRPLLIERFRPACPWPDFFSDLQPGMQMVAMMRRHGVPWGTCAY